MRRYTTQGKKVITDDGTVVRTKGSKAAAKSSAKHLNGLHKAKLQGEWVPPKDSYSKYW